ncbi:hypothetical protein QTO30_10795 [Yoonia sp. GPGPB17]|uniref:hypothetical protein n=1 Tax=Yoonia sp. GPGPB17 TaxID=3026147 RepID=UPI0030BADF58
MKKYDFTKAVAQALILTTLGTVAAADDWVQSFEVKHASIDAEPIVVRANTNGYTSTTTTSKVFAISTA